ncbi:MAG: ATP-binding protein [Desulfurivibrionaceae bacterium]
MKRVPQWLVLTCVMVALALLAGGGWFYNTQKQHLRAEAEATMNAVAGLKVDQIVQWRTARLADAAVLIEGLAVDRFRDWLADPSPEKAEVVLKAFRPRQQHFHYSDISLTDPEGTARLSLSGPTSHRIHEEALSHLAEAFRDHRPVLTDLHSGPGDLPPHLDVIAPFFANDDGTGPPVGAVVMRSDVREFLYPLVQSWPTPSRSAEIVLFRRDGDSVLVLNDLRHHKDAAFKLRLPMSRTELPAVMAVLGKEGTVESSDYRGVEVLAALKAVPDSPWFVSAKIDTAEVFATWRAISALLLGLILMVLAAIATTVGLVWQRQDKAHYRALLLAEKQLRETRADWENIFQGIGHPVFILAPDQTLLAVNQAWEKLSGQRGEEVVGKKCYEVVHKTSSPPLSCPFSKMLRSHEVETAEAEFEAVNRHFLVSCTPVLDKNGVLEKAIVVATDISQAKEAEAEKARLEAQLLQAQKMEAIGTLAGGIAHDFNNILSPIIGYTELALRTLGPDQPLAADLTQVLVAGQRAKELVKQILAFSRQSAQARTPLHIQAIIKETAKLIRSSLPATIEIRQDIAADCGTVLADPIQIHQIVMNLCVNAYHAMKADPTGVLGISLRPMTLDEADAKATVLGMSPGPYVRLEVSDTGCGMDQATMAKIFDPYFTTKAKNGGGTGLGLAVVHGIMQAYGGHVSVYSEPGKGTCFRLYFPAVEGAPVLGQGVVAQELPMGNNERILVLDDEPSIVDMGRSLLEGLGYRVTGFTDCEEAMRAIRARPDDFDLIITDMAMPKMTGLELTKEVKGLRPEMPVILCTGFSELINENTAKKHGICKYLMKPTLTRELAVAVREALDEGE